MRRWAGQLAPVAAAALLVWLLGATFPWLLIWWTAASVLFLMGWVARGNLGNAKGAGEACRWEALADQLDGDLREAEESLARADATIDMLRRNDDLAFLAGQQLRREREEWGLT